MQRCYNRGCGQNFDPKNNEDTACCHHPGAPYFHDAYKGWSCCKKKSVDFTEFLSIKGCTLSKHSNVKPPEPEKPIQQQEQENDAEKLKEQPVLVRAPIKEAMERPSIDTPMTMLTATSVAPALKQAIDNLMATKAKQPIVVDDLEAEILGGAIAVGTTCKNSGCTYSYSGNAGDDGGTCTHHPGMPIFHEGLKYWSCCQRKTTDFAVFMGQRGCVDGQHKWFKENKNNETVQCRYDWHQTDSNVIVSIYAKMYHYALSSIAINPVRLHVILIFPNENKAKFNLDLELRGIIDVSRASVQMYASKVEIVLPKAEPGSWSKLDFANKNQLLSPEKNAFETSSSNKKLPNDAIDIEVDLDDIEAVKAGGVRLAEIDNNN